MLRWIWRLMLLASGAIVGATGWAWHRSYDRTEAVFVQRGSRYMQATVQRGRIDVFWIDNYPATKDGKTLRGYTPDARDPATGYTRGATLFHLQPALEKSRGPIMFSEGSVQANIESPGTRPFRSPLQSAGATFANNDDGDEQATESAADAKLSLSATPRIRIKPSAAPPTRSFEPPPLTLAPPPKPSPTSDKPRAQTVLSGGPGGVTISNSSASWTPRPALVGGLSIRIWPAFTYHAISLPYWLVLAVVSLPLVAGFARVVQHQRTRGRRRRYGQCLNCGYDLRADLDGRCPECGTVRPRG